ncbi:aminopeptidase P family protein [Staphylococcus muscae]|uniref:Peptidase M24 n=1 Tax=Staphylococcus muscae TaxID=1294 RepID=A0A240C600_9STAP|nr:Xaa-Pro peptidase family protein [Staphylococcus muscae]AVQ33098.1 aminopeptidase P family protein [Staphylococcus muscae]PNZ04763.1 aminopeptidase P family protein [Staphylococcus muscae]GGA88373.1 peptidase M24 [Staphylococcus muscae]SNW02528.1 proline dipeptidase [Staphylococcus muscae]
MKHRIEKAKLILKDQDLDALLVLTDYNRRYLSGFTGTSGALIITCSEQFLFTDFRYTEQAAKQATEYVIVEQQGDLMSTLQRHIKDNDYQNIGFEGHIVSYDTYVKLNEGSHQLKPIGEAIEHIRMVKDEGEIANIKKAAEIVDKAYEYILTVAKAGMTEKELKALLESKMLHLGADDTSFDTIVASGYRGALPHGVASDKVIESGDMVTLDFGAYYNGYVSDITRTFAVGQPSDEMIKIYNIVLKAQKTAVSQIKSGMTGMEIDKIARDIIAEAGYGENFGHSLGHGIGLEIHERPMLSHKADNILQPNHCVTVEPGIYVNGIGGVRIEDDILIQENGGQCFTNSTKDLIILKEE